MGILELNTQVSCKAGQLNHLSLVDRSLDPYSGASPLAIADSLVMNQKIPSDIEQFCKKIISDI